MSLINKVLRELDARRADAPGTGSFAQPVRAVPAPRPKRTVWWGVAAVALMAGGALAWEQFRPAHAPAPAQKTGQLPLRMDVDLSMEQPGAPPVSPAQPVPPEPAAAAVDRPAETAAPVVAVSAPAAPPQALVPPPVPAVPADAGQSKRTPKAAVPKEAVPPAPAPEVSQAAPPAKSTARMPKASVPAPEGRPSESRSSEAQPAITKQVREMTPQQRAENEYRKAVLAVQQGKAADALPALELTIQLDPQHAAARQVLIGIMLEQNRREDALRIARDGVQLDPGQHGLAMILARLELEKGELHSAIQTLDRSLPYASDRADYLAFLAAVLQRDGQHKRAVDHYLQALQKTPQQGAWWMGLGISLQADRRLAEAQEAFKRAKATNTLSPELLSFVDARLSQLQR
ncbi:MAG TPA: tetratricopeptide repeat protein [Noviherbaspirillum sp.]|uniref:tetratricopeptide repeat protein n=1 Tax=Noviherbaspirillum sp. TaxID=1926288 RepID=UPI002D69C100|nr:tetratricopeptide repeat protein [Noviherbaspirillum sp.]HYD96061.1 tetratricopeptide repeat protein [Noviherbaspirillum sp.]